MAYSLAKYNVSFSDIQELLMLEDKLGMEIKN
jgi:hypothetical protein